MALLTHPSKGVHECFPSRVVCCMTAYPSLTQRVNRPARLRGGQRRPVWPCLSAGTSRQCIAMVQKSGRRARTQARFTRPPPPALGLPPAPLGPPPPELVPSPVDSGVSGGWALRVSRSVRRARGKGWRAAESGWRAAPGNLASKPERLAHRLFRPACQVPRSRARPDLRGAPSDAGQGPLSGACAGAWHLPPRETRSEQAASRPAYPAHGGARRREQSLPAVSPRPA